MLITNFRVEKRKISLIDNPVPFTGEYNIDTFKFEFDEEWEGLNKTLVIVSDNTYNVSLLNDQCLIPMEFYNKKGSISIGVFGTIGNGKILATGMYPIYIEEDAYKRGQEPANLPTQTQWDLYITEINGLLVQCQATKRQCDEVLAQLTRDYNAYILEFNQIKQDTKDYRDETSTIYAQVEQVKQDIIDMGSARTFATFYVDPQTGELYVVNAESLGNMGFYVHDYNLWVQINTEVN